MPQTLPQVANVDQSKHDAAEVRRSDERSAILEVLEGTDEPMGPKEIASALGWKYGEPLFFNLTNHAVDQGLPSSMARPS